MTRPLSKPLYDNIVTLAPDGEPLCRCNREKADWYLNRGLAEVIQDEPRIIRLKFEPKGRGHAGDDFYLSPKHNVCVVCGTTENHTRHHIVPYCFRKHFPEKAKRHNSHDIVPMCVECHDEYEVFADQLKNALSVRYGVPFMGRGIIFDPHLRRVRLYASALKRYRNRIPQERVAVMEQTLRDFFKKEEITEEDILRAAKIKPMVRSADYQRYGEAIVEKVESLEEFVVMWREHFLNTMKPKHMPSHWAVERKIIHD